MASWASCPVNWTFRMANPDQELSPESESIVDGIASSRHPLTRVLAVDDELAASKLLSIILGPPDYYCAMASNGGHHWRE